MRFICLLLAVSTGTGCVQTTAYRRAALVPTPAGETFTTPLKRKVQLASSISMTDAEEDPFANEGDPGLHLATVMLNAHARFALGKHVALGGQLLWSHLELSEQSTIGTADVTDKHLFGFGPNVSIHFAPAKSPFSIAAALSGNVVFVPWAAWAHVRDDDDATFEAEFSRANHRLVDEGTDARILYRISAGANYQLTEYLALFGGLSVQNSLVNIGFDNTPRDGSTLTGNEIGLVPYVGVTVTMVRGLYGQFQYYVPVGYSQLDDGIYGPYGGLQFTLGANL